MFTPSADVQALPLVVELSCIFGDCPAQYTITSPPLLEPGTEEAVEDVPLMMNNAGEWLLSDISAPGGFRCVCEGEHHSPRHSDIGHYLRFCSDNVDVIFGIVTETRTPIRSLTLHRSADVVGALIVARVEFYPGRDCDFSVRWIRCCRTSGDSVVQEGGLSYVTSFADADTKIRARAFAGDESAPRDSDFTAIIKRGLFTSPVIVQQALVGTTLALQTDLPALWFHDSATEPIAAGPTLRVAHMDVGHRIRGSVARKSLTYDELMPDPVPVAPLLEDTVVDLEDVFHGEHMDGLRNLWFRSDFANQVYEQVGEGRSCRLSFGDVGSAIRVVSIDPSGGEQCADISAVVAAPVRLPTVAFDSRGRVVLDASERILSRAKLLWRKWRNGRSEVLKKCTESRLIPHPTLIGCAVEAGLQLPDEDIQWTNQLLIEYAVPLPDAVLTDCRPLVVGAAIEVKVAPAGALRPHFRWRRWDGLAFLAAPQPEPRRSAA
jgi:hypothetical protein